MRIRCFVLLLVFSWPGSIAYGQEVAGPVSAELRVRVLELLAYDCGVEEVEGQFRIQIAELGQEVQPLLISVVRDGLPDETRRNAQFQAEGRFDRRQAWLKENGEDLFGEDSERLSAKTKEEFVADALRRSDILFRENAVRGLGVIGNDEAARAIEAASTEEPGLSGLAEAALQEIAERD